MSLECVMSISEGSFSQAGDRASHHSGFPCCGRQCGFYDSSHAVYPGPQVFRLELAVCLPVCLHAGFNRCSRHHSYNEDKWVLSTARPSLINTQISAYGLPPKSGCSNKRYKFSLRGSKLIADQIELQTNAHSILGVFTICLQCLLQSCICYTVHSFVAKFLIHRRFSVLSSILL